MKKKKIILFGLILVIGILISIPSFATEELVEININPDNYYEMREKLYNDENSVKAKIYYSDGKTLSAYDYVIQELKNFNTAIDISSYKILAKDMNAFMLSIYDSPEIFFIGQVANYYTQYIPELDITIGDTLLFNYTMTKQEVDEANILIEDVVKDYLSGIKLEWNNLEKVLYTNNYLCQMCKYADDIIASSHTLYGALVDKRPVCDGYSKAFQFLLSKVGIESVLATSNQMVHAWNLVKLDGDYYHIDVTWNDDNGGIGKTYYKFFLASDTEFEKNRQHYGWESNGIKATNTKYDIMPKWDGIDNYLIYKDNYWYGLSSSAQTYSIGLRKIDLRSDTKTQIKTITTSFVFLPPGLTTDGEYLYFTTKYNIWKMNYDGSNVTEFFELPNKDKQVLFSVEFINNKFYYDTWDIEENGGASSATRKTNTYAPIVGVILDKKNLTLEIGQKALLSATVIPEDTEEDKSLVWSTSDKSVVTVDQKGNVTAVKEGTATITVSTTSGKVATCTIEVVDEIIFTTLPVVKIDNKDTISFSTKNKIQTILTAENFPVLNKNYIVEVYYSDAVKKSTENVGAKNIIKIKDASGSVIKEYIAIVNGDINGDGNVQMYDSFQILKGAIVPGSKLDGIDTVIRDFNNDGSVLLFDAFQFLKRAIIGL